MKRRNTVAIAAVVVALLALAAAIYFLRPGSSPQPSTAQAPEASESPAPATPTPPAATAPAEEEKAAETPAEEKTADEPALAEEKAAGTPAPAEEETEEKTAEGPTATENKTADKPTPAEQADDTPAPAGQRAKEATAPAEKEKTAEATPAEPASEVAELQPSFDVVRIEPTGDGVLAGRAAPGWKIVIESRGETVAEALADDQGEWTVIFDRPLPPGAHDLSVKATSPDGSKEFTSTQSVSADVAEPPTKRASLPEAETARLSDTAPPASMPSASPSVTTGHATEESAPPLPQTASVDEERATPPSSLPPQTRPGNYTILPGDTLWDIATRYLGAGWRYKQIYKDNRKIIRNPNLIYPEQKMTIAEPPTEAN